MVKFIIIAMCVTIGLLSGLFYESGNFQVVDATMLPEFWGGAVNCRICVVNNMCRDASPCSQYEDKTQACLTNQEMVKSADSWGSPPNPGTNADLSNFGQCATTYNCILFQSTRQCIQGTSAPQNGYRTCTP